jgi:hypothetical protein
MEELSLCTDNVVVVNLLLNVAYTGTSDGGLPAQAVNTLLYAQDNLGGKKVSAPSKNPAKCPIICFAREKKLISRTFKISGTLIVKTSLWRNIIEKMSVFLSNRPPATPNL